jgi:hypothetical protein
MRSLQTLELKDIWPSADSFEEWSGMWDILNGAPSLNNLKVRIQIGDLSGLETPLLHLTQLHVDLHRPTREDSDWDEFDDELVGITNWSDEMPALQRLTICGVKYQTYANCNGLLNALLEEEDEGASPLVFPLLEELILNCCEADMDILLHFSRERSPSTPTETNRAFTPCRITMLNWEELPDIESAFSDQLENELREAGIISDDDDTFLLTE